MCVSKTLVAIKQGEFPGGKLLGETGNRQDAGPHPTYTHNALFYPDYPAFSIKRFKRLLSSSNFLRLSECLIPKNYPYFLDKTSQSPLHNCAWLAIYRDDTSLLFLGPQGPLRIPLIFVLPPVLPCMTTVNL